MLLASTVINAESLPIPAPPSFDASSYVLMDFGSGAVLADHNSNERVDPASITKIMTAYVVYKSLEAGDITLEDQVEISEYAWRSIGSRMFVEVGDKIKLEHLMLGLIIQSGNDASIALAEHVAGTEQAFADVMNAQAKRIGMKDSHFVNATGLPDTDHYTTAYDIALLSRAMISEFPEEYKRYAQKEYTFNGIKQFNRNRLLWRDSAVDGIKTGHTEAAGYCLAASAIKNDMRLISAVMGTDSDKARTVNSQALLNYGFRYYESHKLYKAGEVLAQQRMWKGESKSIQLGLDKDLFVTIPRGRYEDLKADMDINAEIVAPIQQGDQVGVVKVTLKGENYLEQSLVALQSNPEGGLWRRIVDFFVKLLF
ncbi:MAG: D-alanyl-D-alanine carboxypeptidase [Gammaproteobacteria bacterium]|nr:D-alanyl-D-alanine carboxypeptidase [Gammaproteobacteria bacterium]NNC66431.1 D-alanyl-D-alanine carboxypeptidase [Gammaproteobacteria bacterium]